MTSKAEEKIYRFWWLHDGTWYQNVAKRFGFAVANEINKDSLRTMAQRTMQTYVKENSINTAFTDINEVIEPFMHGSSVLWPDGWCQTSAKILSPDTFEVVLSENFAINWLRRAGTLEHYECPGLALREGWFAGFGIKNYEQEEVECMVKGSDVCRFRARILGIGEEKSTQ